MYGVREGVEGRFVYECELLETHRQTGQTAQSAWLTSSHRESKQCLVAVVEMALTKDETKSVWATRVEAFRGHARTLALTELETKSI